ncbi:MAG: 50S ribosomal protein L18 [Peptococcaceae bacterium]|jgi:large subunit ribosomal protein L18|nr:50S ribosomal protein L18 [Peptococcaceae bacterium]
MINPINRKAVRQKKHLRIRKNIVGTPDCPRLAVFRSLQHIYAQLIDDTKGVTLLSASTLEAPLKGTLDNTGNVEAAKKVGLEIGKKAVDKGIAEVVFDRGGNIYHGRVKALAEGAREAGLNF